MKHALDGLEKYRVDTAIVMYEQKKVNLNTAARMAGLPVRDFMGELENRGVVLNLTSKMVTSSLEVLAGAFESEKLYKVLQSESVF